MYKSARLPAIRKQHVHVITSNTRVKSASNTCMQSQATRASNPQATHARNHKQHVRVICKQHVRVVCKQHVRAITCSSFMHARTSSLCCIIPRIPCIPCIPGRPYRLYLHGCPGIASECGIDPQEWCNETNIDVTDIASVCCTSCCPCHVPHAGW